MTKNEILEGLHQRINSVIAGSNESSVADFGLKKIVNDTLTESNFHPEVVKAMGVFDTAINENVNQHLIVRPLLECLTKYASLFDGIKKNVAKLKKMILEHEDDINLYELFESIDNSDIKHFVGASFENYLAEKSLENKAALVGVLESASGYDNSTMRLLGYLKENAVVGQQNVINIYENVNEAEMIDFQGQKFVQTADGKLQSLNTIDTAKIFEAVDEYVSEIVNESKARQLEEQEAKNYRSLDSELHLLEHVTKLQKKYPENERLQSVLNEYASALYAGCREEMLFETFLHRMHEGFDYLNDVELAIDNIKSAAKAHKHHIDFVKVFEQMANSSYAYLIPIIEGVVYDYVKNPNPQTRNILLNQLRMYESCPQVVAMMMYANEEEGIMNENFSAKDSQKFIQQHAHTESVFSPIQYIRENECVFSVENRFYVKKGHNITKLSKDAVSNLSENFVALSILVNDPHIEINEHENKITYYTTNKVVEINEKFALIDGQYESVEDLKSLVEMHVKYPEMDEVNFLTAAFLLENFNNIAKVDFVTKIALNENDNKTLDLFKVKDNIFVASHDNINEEHTFYRNVKPLQLKNIINRHFGLNVSNLFEELMPNQDKIVAEINELKNEYENRIESLLEMKQQIETIIEENGETEELLESVKQLTAQIKEAKREYKLFENKAKEIEEGNPEDNDAVTEKAPVKKGKKKVKDVSEEGETPELGDEAEAELGGDSEFSDFGEGDFDLDGSDFEIDGSEDFDLDGSDFEFDGSEFEDDEFTTSDGDDMTQSLEDFETDPFGDDGSDFDFSATKSQDGDYSMEGFDEFGEPTEPEVPETPEDFNIGDESVLGAEEDPFGAGMEGVGMEGEVTDAITGEPEERTEQKSDDADLDYANFKIVKIDFDANVRTGERKSTGKAIVVVPWIDDFGNKTSETKTIPFYITDIQGEKGVVLDTTGMTVEMYNAVTDAIKNSSDFETVDAQPSGVMGDTESETADDIPNGVEDEEFDPMNSEMSEPFDSGSDETTVLTIDDGVEPQGIDVATYQSGDTEIELPANNISMEGDPVVDDKIADAEIDNPILDIMGESRKSKNDPFAHLFEGVEASAEAIEPNDTGKGVELVTSETQEDPISVVEDVLTQFAEEMGLDEDDDEVVVEVGEIEDYDIDGSEISSIKATIGENEYAFFTLEDQMYSCLAEDFDEYSEELETLEEFVDSDNENLASCSLDDVRGIVDLVTDIISIETGEDFEYEIEGDDEENEDVDENPEYREDLDIEGENF